jgi:hypothetical protein
MKLPILGRVPSTSDGDLVVKATHSGITLLGKFVDGKFVEDRRYRSRYAGSKTCAVDINGNLWLNAGELKKKVLAAGLAHGKKKAGGQPSKKKKLVNEEQISEDIPVITKKPRKSTYSVNKKEVRQRIMGYTNTQRGKKEMYFWTVSFPAGTFDAVCYQAFNTWLTSLRKYKMLRHYLWVAERQEGDRITDGRAPTHTLHFHICIPHYMNVTRANAMMRGTLKNLAKEGKMPVAANSRQIIKYNGVDIAKHRNTKRVINFAVKKGARSLAYYLSKYVSKNNTEFTHFAWHNSRAFSALFTGVTFMIPEFIKYELQHFLNRTRIFKMEFATFIPWINGPPPILERHLFQLNSYIQNTLFNE